MTAQNELLELLHRLRFYITPEHTCSYLPRHDAVTLFADPGAPMNERIYSTLVALGFRRSGEHIYRPHCPNCRQCVPVRIAVQNFKPNRSQRRNLQCNSDITTHWQDAHFTQEHFDLYKQYLLARHPGSSMATDDPDQYQRMMLTSWGSARLLELRERGRLLAVGMTDWLDDGLSAVYTYFDPHENQRGLGIYSVLQQIETTRSLGHPYLYLGYWIAACDNMSYKRNFSALHYFNGQTWSSIDTYK
jgi:leucyl-tRNA---protein transferase